MFLKKKTNLNPQKNVFKKKMLFVGLNRSAFDNKTVSFEEHIKCEHNMWHYLYFIVLVKVKDPTEFTGPESYVYAMVKVCQNMYIFLFLSFQHKGANFY